MRRRIVLLPVLLLTALALLTPAGALAAGESTSGYNQKPKEPTTGTSPSKEEKTTPTTPTTPASTPEAAKTSTSPTTTTTEKATTLPFTGFDLRWSLVGGLVLIAAGFSIVVVQRRERRDQR